MKLIRSLAACGAVTLVFSLAPGIAPPASAAGRLVTSPATVPATAGQVLPLAALFQPVRGASPEFQYISVVVTLTGGLTFADGGRTIASDGPLSLPSVLGVPVTAKSYGRATLTVTALDNNAPVTDEATTMVDVPRPAPLPGEVRLLSSLGAASAKVGQPLPIGSLFKAADVENQFNIVFTLIEVKLTGGLVFTATGEQSTAASGKNSHSKTMTNMMLATVRANGSGTVTLNVTAKTATFEIKDEATAAVNVPTPAPAPAPPTPAGGAPAVGGGNHAPVAQSMPLVAVAGAVTPLTLLASDPDANALTFVLVQLPAHGKLSGQAPNLSYTPDGGFLGTDALIFSATDGAASSAQATVTITVTGKAASTAKTVRKVIKKTVKKTTKKR